jgi:hypothetical protein
MWNGNEKTIQHFEICDKGCGRGLSVRVDILRSGNPGNALQSYALVSGWSAITATRTAIVCWWLLELVHYLSGRIMEQEGHPTLPPYDRPSSESSDGYCNISVSYRVAINVQFTVDRRSPPSLDSSDPKPLMDTMPTPSSFVRRRLPTGISC